MECFCASVIAVCFCIIVFFSSVYIYIYHTCTYWKRRGVKYFEMIENYDRFFMRRVNQSVIVDTVYKKCVGDRFYGIIHYKAPVLVLRDPALIHRVLTTDFNCFEDRFHSINIKIANDLLLMNGSQWKEVRKKLEPLFRLKKLKKIVQKFASSSIYFSEVIDIKLLYENEIEICEVMLNYSMNSINSVAMGFELNSLNNNSMGFIGRGSELFRRSFLSMLDTLKDALDFKLVKHLQNVIGMQPLPKYVKEFYICLLKESVAFRRNSNLQREDLIQVLIDLNKCDVKEAGPAMSDDTLLDDSFLASYMFGFYTMGIKTVGYSLSICLLELAENVDVQRKLREEILSIVSKGDDSITFANLKEMKYMDKVISETLRKYPVAIGLVRTSTTEYKIPDSDVVIDKGVLVYIPVYSIHRDPDYYQNPENFDPERFSEENKKERQVGTYLPFGTGPRGCIGVNFAILQMKVALAHLLSRYEFRLTEKTTLPIEFSSKSGFLAPKDGIWLHIKHR